MDKKFLEVSQIKLRGIKKVEGMKFHDIEGGFGEGKKAMLAKEIAGIHGRDIKDINRNINNNIERFKNGIDILDLKTGEYKPLVLEMGFTNAQYGNANNIYLLSERGYSKLLKILEDDVAWEQYEKLVDGYFNMRAEKKQLSPMEQLKLQYQVLEEHEERFIKIENQLESLEVNPSQRKRLQNARHKKVFSILGGKKSVAYKNASFRGKVYSNLGRAFNNYFDVTAYDCTPKNRFDEALEFIDSYNLSTELTMELKKINNQVSFEEAM